MELNNVCNDTVKIVKKVGEFIREERKKFASTSIEYKGTNDMVSYVDKQSQEQLIERLAKLIPGCGFIAEEKDNNEPRESFTWIIDPLDGTTNFVHGLPPYSISVGLMNEEQLILGVVYEVNLDECYYAYQNGGAYLNKDRISVSATTTMKTALVGTGFPYSNFDRFEDYMKVFDYCMKNTHGVRRPGSAAVDLAYTAAGRFDAFYEYGLNAWDVAAGAMIIREAGGIVTDFSGGNNFLFGKEIIATNSKVHREFLEVIIEKFKK